ncbi:uncharacterized protein LOC106478523 [Limulus polyphemus]|uniref:Uncharacterized protein LOC106478523 n=1 Tax=Limulus polyphemus TaxID=6850 RepID=A0ABM1S2J3_LIMPO|nr:uncharacterized protein LOC106478523 [Limulus polyphemus]
MMFGSHARVKLLLAVCSVFTIYSSTFSERRIRQEWFRFLPAPPGRRPACAESGRTYCEHAINYPTDVVTSVLRGISGKRFNVSSIFVDEREGLQEPPEDLLGGPPSKPRSKRSFSTGTHGSLASSCCQKNTLAPKVALNKRHQWRFVASHVITQRGIVEQKVSIMPCQKGCHECEKKLVDRLLISLDPLGRLVPDLFMVPFCCQCLS